MYSPSDTGLGMAWGRSLFTSVSNKRRGAKLRLLFKSFPRPLLKSDMGPLARYSNHQEIINRRPEQMYTSFDTRFECPRERPLFELDLNKRRAQTGPLFELVPRSLLNSGLLPVDRCGTCQETISRRLEHMYTRCLGKGHYTSRSRINAGGGANCGYYSSHFWVIIKFRPEALVQIWHPPDHKWET